MSDLVSGALGALGGPAAKLLLQTVGAQIGATYGKALANAAGTLLVSGIDTARVAVDGLEREHPAVVAALAAVRSACAGFIHLPTEDELFAGLNHMARALIAAAAPQAEG
jgi:hypothetical protein